MKKTKLLSIALISISMLTTSCSKENICDYTNKDRQYVVTINSPSTRVLNDQVQGGGKYSDGETVSLYTTELKFTAEASGSAGGKWLSDDPQARVILTSGINQDWSVTIKDYYCDVTFDNTAVGGDGTVKTVTMKFGEQLPTPTPVSGYIFEGWYDGDKKIVTVPNSPNRTITAKFVLLSDRFAFLTTAAYNSGHLITPEYTQEIGMAWTSAFAYGNGKYIVAGGTGVNSSSQVAISTDGINWSAPVQIASIGTPSCVLYSYGDNFVMTYGKGFILYSNNGGKTWIANEIGVSNNTWSSVAYGNGKYVAVGDRGYITASIDGQSWTSPKQVGTEDWKGITYGNGKYVIVSTGGYISTSADGVNWTIPIKVGSYDSTHYFSNWTKVCYGNGIFVAVGSHGKIATSVDGINWNQGGYGTDYWDKIAFNNGTFCIIGTNGFSKSADGKQWTTPIEIKSYHLADVCAIP